MEKDTSSSPIEPTIGTPIVTEEIKQECSSSSLEDDHIEDLYIDYLREVRDSGLPLWLKDIY